MSTAIDLVSHASDEPGASQRLPAGAAQRIGLWIICAAVATFSHSIISEQGSKESPASSPFFLFSDATIHMTHIGLNG